MNTPLTTVSQVSRSGEALILAERIYTHRQHLSILSSGMCSPGNRKLPFGALCPPGQDIADGRGSFHHLPVQPYTKGWFIPLAFLSSCHP